MKLSCDRILSVHLCVPMRVMKLLLVVHTLTCPSLRKYQESKDDKERPGYRIAGGRKKGKKGK